MGGAERAVASVKRRGNNYKQTRGCNPLFLGGRISWH